jgi:hypothetical protein
VSLLYKVYILTNPDDNRGFRGKKIIGSNNLEDFGNEMRKIRRSLGFSQTYVQRAVGDNIAYNYHMLDRNSNNLKIEKSTRHPAGERASFTLVKMGKSN